MMVVKRLMFTCWPQVTSPKVKAILNLFAPVQFMKAPLSSKVPSLLLTPLQNLPLLPLHHVSAP